MTYRPFKIFAPSKVNVYNQKIKAYLNGESIYPTTIELDLTQLCTRSCPECPYSESKKAGLTLQLPFLDRLFGILGSHTPGIVLSGGEPTISPFFSQTAKLARNKGFQEIAIISNGANINRPDVQDALLEHVSAIRISLYDWHEDDSVFFTNTLKKIEDLRKRRDAERSKLQIGASLLTRKDWNSRYQPVGLKAINAGIDWLYFHPYCIEWNKKNPIQADQSGVLESIEMLRKAAPQNANIQVPLERYEKNPLYFEKLHGAYFLIQVGADGVNYAGPECKYEKDAVLLNLNNYLKDDFLWHPQRLKRLSEINSDNYRFIGTKHRPPIYSDYIQKLKQLKEGNEVAKNLQKPSERFYNPNII